MSTGNFSGTGFPSLCNAMYTTEQNPEGKVNNGRWLARLRGAKRRRIHLALCSHPHTLGTRGFLSRAAEMFRGRPRADASSAEAARTFFSRGSP